MDISSSSRADDGFVAFLRRSLEVIRHEAPWIFSALCRRLSGQVVRIRVDDEVIALGFSTANYLEVTRAQAMGATTVSLTTRSSTILDLIDARKSLVDAVLSEDLRLAGRPHDLIAFDDGLAVYLGGAVRCRSFEELLHDFRHRERPRLEGG